jgi:PAS domain S-box-containing protein
MDMKKNPGPASAGDCTNPPWIVAALLEQFEDCVYLLDGEGRCFAANRAFCHWIGRAESEVRGRTVFDFWPDEVAKRESAQWQQVLGGAELEREEERPRGADLRRIRLRLTPLRDAIDTIRGGICRFHEVSSTSLVEPSVAFSSASLSGAHPQMSAIEAVRKTILVVEPNPTIRLLVTTILAQQNLRIFSCEEGRQAIELFHAKRDEVDLALVELNLPGQSGLETMSDLWRVQPRLRILVVSGLGVPGSSWWTTTPDHRFLSKPFTPHQLVQSVRELLGSRIEDLK